MIGSMTKIKQGNFGARQRGVRGEGCSYGWVVMGDKLSKDVTFEQTEQGWAESMGRDPE